MKKNACLKGAAAASLALLLAGAAFADTVIWYRFDDQEPLTSTAAGVYVTNCVAATYPAHPRTINGNFDELRVSRGVLPVESFMRALPDGTILVVR